MLLSDDKVAKFLNEQVVPCWESLRPAPKVNIDFGDGRKLTRTLQGNTVMYLCLADGRVVDALPGVYTPADFLAQVNQGLTFLREKGNKPTWEQVHAWHQTQTSTAVRSEMMRIMVSKARVESPLLNALGAKVDLKAALSPSAQGTAAAAPVDAKGAFEAVSARIEDVSKQPSTGERLKASYREMPPEKRPSAEEMGRQAVAADSRANVQLVRPAVHLLFATYTDLPSVSTCKDDVYKRVLHVPIDDPYFGLADVLVPGTPGGS